MNSPSSEYPPLFSLHRSQFDGRLFSQGQVSPGIAGQIPMAFSLLELLVVLAVSGILIALISIAFNSAIHAAKRAECMNNLRQIGQANLAYAADNQGILASGRSSGRERPFWWRYNLRTYFGAANGDGTWQGDLGFCPVLVCPSDPTRGGEDVSGEVGESLRRSYNVNAKLERTIGGTPVRYRLQEIPYPSQVLYAMNANWSQTGRGEFINGDSLAHLGGLPREWHQGMVNAVFLDGHVESIDIHDLYPGQPRHGIFFPNPTQ